MRGIPKYNYPAFVAAAHALRVRGWLVYNPAEMDAEMDTEDYAERTLGEQKVHDTANAARHFARRDLNILTDHMWAENEDAIVTLPGWESSAGAQAEVHVAQWVGLKTLTLAEALALGFQIVV